MSQVVSFFIIILSVYIDLNCLLLLEHIFPYAGVFMWLITVRYLVTTVVAFQ